MWQPLYWDLYPLAFKNPHKGLSKIQVEQLSLWAPFCILVPQEDFQNGLDIACA